VFLITTNFLSGNFYEKPWHHFNRDYFLGHFFWATNFLSTKTPLVATKIVARSHAFSRKITTETL